MVLTEEIGGGNLIKGIRKALEFPNSAWGGITHRSLLQFNC